MLAEEAPKITDWMQAWGSLAGLVMSTFAVIFTGWLLRHEIKVRREERADTDAMQARLVVGELSNWEGEGPSAEVYGPIDRVQCEVKNYSGAPIFDVEVTVDGRWQGGSPGVFPQDGDRYWIACDPPIRPEWGAAFDPQEVEVEIQFTDSAGLRWHRRMGEPPERIVFRLPRPSGLGRWIPMLRKDNFDPNPPF